MRILYVFPHPDDESFGPGPAIYQQQRSGHAVSILTLTRGEATRQRERYGYSRSEMADVRSAELRAACAELGVEDLRVLDFPDDGLAELDPRELEGAVARALRRVRPHVVVTYAVHGISGFADHLVSHAVVKRTYCVLREELSSLRRLALFTVSEEQVSAQEQSESIPLTPSSPEEIDCRISVDAEAEAAGNRALDRYETYQAIIDETGIRDSLSTDVCFECFQEQHSPALGALTEGLEVATSP